MFGIETLRIPNRELFMLDAAPVTDWIGVIVKRREDRSGRKVGR